VKERPQESSEAVPQHIHDDSAVTLSFLQIDVEPLRQSTFSRYGTVIENPACSTFSFEQHDIALDLQAVPEIRVQH
jgi:hypothetical protein